ncbi:unnamed protein product, partial [Discosporangium mesarthrocarpum]
MTGVSRRTKRAASHRRIAEAAWAQECVNAWETAQHVVSQAVELSHPRERYEVLMFPDASDQHWGYFLTQVPVAELAGDIAGEDMSHEPLGFLSGSFRGPQMRWATVDKEAFAIVSTYRRLEWVLWR